MMQAIVVKGTTAVKATVIANRTKSDEIGIVKAMMIETLKTKLQNGIAHFTFIKKNGELRENVGVQRKSILQKLRQMATEKAERTIAQQLSSMSRKELGEVSDGNLWLKCFNPNYKGCQLVASFFILLNVKQ